MVQYKILFSETLLKVIKQYKEDIFNDKVKPGAYLQKQIKLLDESIKDITTERFVELLLKTKKPIIFAESEVKGDGTDWNRLEFKILGDISLSMDVEVYDNGVWLAFGQGFCIHDPPLRANLIFTPGPLLICSKGRPVPDLEEVQGAKGIDEDKYNALIERRLLPDLLYANLDAEAQNKQALVVLPGLGCGAFAGDFQGEMGECLNKALRYVLEKHGDKLSNILCIRFDPFDECENLEIKIHDIIYRVRLNGSPLGKPQLSKIQDFEETKDEFKDCVLYKIVAWDHFSFPGNDYFVGTRATDDGVTAAATNSMEIITGVKGVYKNGFYLTPSGSRAWKYIVDSQKCHLVANGNVVVGLLNGSCTELNELEGLDKAVLSKKK